MTIEYQFTTLRDSLNCIIYLISI